MINFSNQILIEGRYDSLTRKISNDIFYVVGKTKGIKGPLEVLLPEEISEDDSYIHESGIEISVVVQIQRMERLYYGGEYRDFHVHTFIDEDDFLVTEITIDSDKEPQSYEQLLYKINEDVRHEVEHYTQDIMIDKPSRGETSRMETTYLHHKDPSEVEALVHGFYRRAKMEKRPIDVIMWEDLNRDIDLGHITQEEAKDLFEKWVNYSRRRLPKAIYSNQ
jgi:hypothetical protein